MTKNELKSKIKSTGTTYLLWFAMSAHYAYLGRWGLQFLYWFTLGGLGFWAIADMFTIPGKVKRHNAKIFQQIEEIEEREREELIDEIRA